MINCNVCHQRQKDVIITKCWHMFCQHCIKRNLGGRRRRRVLCYSVLCCCAAPTQGSTLHALSGGQAACMPRTAAWCAPGPAPSHSTLLTEPPPLAAAAAQSRGTASAPAAAWALGRATSSTSSSHERWPAAASCSRLHDSALCAAPAGAQLGSCPLHQAARRLLSSQAGPALSQHPPPILYISWHQPTTARYMVDRLV